MAVYEPKKFTHEEIKEFLTPEAMVLVTAYFENNPKKTVFKLSDKKNQVTVRRFTYKGAEFRYTISVR